MMEWIIENWYVLVGIACVVAAIIKFAGLPTETQIKKVKEWLLYAVSVAEAELGSGTGQLKLRRVYDMFVEKFPAIVKFITFDRFAELVDEALDELDKLLETNMAIKAVIIGEVKKNE